MQNAIQEHPPGCTGSFVTAGTSVSVTCAVVRNVWRRGNVNRSVKVFTQCRLSHPASSSTFFSFVELDSKRPPEHVAEEDGVAYTVSPLPSFENFQMNFLQ